MASPREDILNRLLAIIGSLDGVETSARNMDRVVDMKMPAAILFDGDEDSFENLRATGPVPNVVIMAPQIVIAVLNVPEGIGTATNEWLAKVQSAVLLDATLDSMCGGRSAPSGGRIPNGGARYMSAQTNLQEGRTSEINLTVNFAISYPFKPMEL